ncbi:phosphate permease, partial [Thermococci archaeon]
IIDPALISDPQIFIWAMTAALLSAALWLNFATSIGAPVSTTHSIVGGVMGAGIAAAGFAIVDWGTMAKIASSWVISPVLGGVIAAGFLYFIKKNIVFKDDMISSAKKFVPILITIMVWVFATYLMLKGMKKIVKVDFGEALAIGFVISIIVYYFAKPMIVKATLKLDNSRVSVNTLFTIPLIFSAALLSFAHGANDVANAIGPVAAVYAVATMGLAGMKVPVPKWILAMGGLGIAVGVATYGYRVMETVGKKITELTNTRGFSIDFSAATVVLIASWLGLPVSTTHTVVGAVIGVGLARGVKAINKDIVKDIVISWFVTVPVAAIIGGIVFKILMVLG